MFQMVRPFSYFFGNKPITKHVGGLCISNMGTIRCWLRVPVEGQPSAKVVSTTTTKVSIYKDSARQLDHSFALEKRNEAIA
jgi:hypothetical protein